MRDFMKRLTKQLDDGLERRWARSPNPNPEIRFVNCVGRAPSLSGREFVAPLVDTMYGRRAGTGLREPDRQAAGDRPVRPLTRARDDPGPAGRRWHEARPHSGLAGAGDRVPAAPHRPPGSGARRRGIPPLDGGALGEGPECSGPIDRPVDRRSDRGQLPAGALARVALTVAKRCATSSAANGLHSRRAASRPDRADACAWVKLDGAGQPRLIPASAPATRRRTAPPRTRARA